MKAMALTPILTLPAKVHGHGNRRCFCETHVLSVLRISIINKNKSPQQQNKLTKTVCSAPRRPDHAASLARWNRGTLVAGGCVTSVLSGPTALAAGTWEASSQSGLMVPNTRITPSDITV